jgi:ribose 5-phosphate isomerase B
MSAKIYLGADHAGFALKEKIKLFLAPGKHKVSDLGAERLRRDDDYPDFAAAVAKKVSAGRAMGILVCGSAQGVSIAANKFRGIRAVAAFSEKDARLSREHNDANVLCLSGWRLGALAAQKIVKTFLETRFSREPRHKRRVRKILAIEKQTMKRL